MGDILDITIVVCICLLIGSCTAKAILDDFGVCVGSQPTATLGEKK